VTPSSNMSVHISMPSPAARALSWASLAGAMKPDRGCPGPARDGCAGHVRRQSGSPSMAGTVLRCRELAVWAKKLPSDTRSQFMTIDQLLLVGGIRSSQSIQSTAWLSR
jgi:hypothetical protein